MKKAFRIVVINLAILLAGGIAAELIFGGWIGRNYGTLVIPRDFSRRFDVSELYPWPAGTIEYRRDEHGLRGQYDDPSRIDILTVGGSTTNEIFIDEGHTWSDVLAREYRSDGKQLTVVNAGVDGQSTIGNIRNFDLWFPMVPGLKARYVIVYVGINDQAVIESGYTNKQDDLTARRRKFKQYLINNSAIYTLFRNIRGMIVARQANLIHIGQTYAGVDWQPLPDAPDVAAYEARYRKELDAYAARVLELAAAIRKFGAEPVFVTQHRASYRIRDGRVFGKPGPDGIDPGGYTGLVAVNRQTMAACRRAEAVCVDLAADLLFVDGDNYDSIHTTPTGSDKIGRYLYAQLKDRLRF